MKSSIYISYSVQFTDDIYAGACTGIGKGGGGPKSESLFFFFCFSIFQGGGPAQKIAEKMIF